MINEIVNLFNMGDASREIAKIQLEHRLKLINFWGIASGSRVLEIGCGQGDTTIALAFTVGEDGFVYGVDIAPDSYGSPETLGEARQRIKNSSIGDRLEMKFNFDVLDDKVSFEKNQFDYVILSHCLWYFSSKDMLKSIIERIKDWGEKICIAEWNPDITLPEQLPHYKAATIQAICESYKHSSQSNIRTMFYPNDIRNILLSCGIDIIKEGDVYSPNMQDCEWEVSMTLNLYPEEICSLNHMPHNLKGLLLSQINELKGVTSIKPMASFCLLGIHSKNHTEMS